MKPLLTHSMQVRLLALFAVVGTLSALLPTPRLTTTTSESEAETPLQQQLIQEFLVKYKAANS